MLTKVLVTPGGAKIHSVSWTTAKAHIATVYFHHGLGEHVARYDRVFTRLSLAGIQVHGFDARGHGQTRLLNGDAHGDSGDWKDIEGVIQLVIDSFPSDKPRFLMGHSMGGFWMLKYALEHGSEFHGAIICSPAIQPGTPINPLKHLFGRIGSYLVPKLTIKSGLDRCNLSRIREEVQWYEADPLVHPYISLRTAASLLKEGDRIKGATEIHIPCSIFISHGTDDKLTSPEASKAFFDKATVPSACTKQSLWIEGGFHERTVCSDDFYLMALVHIDLCSDQVIEAYIDWIRKLKPAA